MRYGEVRDRDVPVEALLALSADWEAEGSCRGYRRNEESHLAGRRVFLAQEGEAIAGYLFGVRRDAAEDSSVMSRGTPCFEVEELYVVPALRSRGIGRALFRCAEETLRPEGVEYLTLTTSNVNARAILHFYLDELGMEFWSARLFKKLR